MVWEMFPLNCKLSLMLVSIGLKSWCFDVNKFTRKFKFANILSNCSGKIWVFSDSSVSVSVKVDHVQFLHCEFSFLEFPSPICCSFVYASCYRQGRRELWEQLSLVAQNDMPWCVVGDFNIILNVNERKWSGVPSIEAMDEFAHCLLDCGLHDAGFEGDIFTWTNQKLWQRLDRALLYSKWSDMFNLTRVQHLIRSKSDHCPILISFQQSASTNIPSFRFQNMWVKHHLFLQEVKQNWEMPSRLVGMRKLGEKLHRLKQFLRWWNKHHFGNIHQRVHDAEQAFMLLKGLTIIFLLMSILLILKGLRLSSL